MMGTFTYLLIINALMLVVRIISTIQGYARDANHLAYRVNSMQMIVNHVLLAFSSTLGIVHASCNVPLEHMLMQLRIVLLVIVVVSIALGLPSLVQRVLDQLFSIILSA